MYRVVELTGKVREYDKPLAEVLHETYWNGETGWPHFSEAQELYEDDRLLFSNCDSSVPNLYVETQKYMDYIAPEPVENLDDNPPRTSAEVQTMMKQLKFTPSKVRVVNGVFYFD